ncbi:SUMO1 sentrin specific peptidase 8 [Coemansia biformis]|uniref:SUMO1 sentrin specific peptidase 8 n=1 Tax=Coemansia biformis TaxID=1286918 RepID=A0A9W8CZ54_9FUNG|nr:SUMO1 sentrin specific peptidase 8 [Coemansia biformis]
MAADHVVLDFENAEVRASDYESLKPEGWLTGEIINFYWTFLERREFYAEPAVLFLGTYTAYRIGNAESATVTDNISAQLSDELKQHQVILIPLNNRSHWSLLVYCRLTRTFYHYDSISRYNRSFAERAAGKFLRVLEPRLKEGFYFKSMQTPQQNNDYDCGIYVLAIAEELARRFINNKRKGQAAGREPEERARVHASVHHRATNGARDFGAETVRHKTMAPPTCTTHQQHQRRNHSTPPVARVPVPPTEVPPAAGPSSPSRATASDLLMPKFGRPFSGFYSPFVPMCPDGVGGFRPLEPLLKGGGSDPADLAGGGSGGSGGGSGTSRSREERVRLEEAMMERAGLPRDFWLVTVEDIEYPQCMRRRIRSLVVDLRRQQKQQQQPQAHGRLGTVR